MLRLFCFLALAPLAAAQIPTAQPVPAPRATSALPSEAAGAASDDLHTFQIVGGQVHLDGIAVPGAVPSHLDLDGLSTPPLEYVGPVAPVIEVDGRAYVFEGGRLVSLAESSRAGRGVFLIGDLVPESEPMADASDDALALVSEEVYMRDVAGRDRGLYESLHLERTLELDAVRLAERIRAAPAGAERTRMRADLRSLLSQLLALKQQLRRREIDRAQHEIDALRSALDRRDAQHEAMVDARLRELCGE